MLQQDNPDDYVLATGETHTIKEFVENAFKAAGYEIVWEDHSKAKIEKFIYASSEETMPFRRDYFWRQFVRPVASFKNLYEILFVASHKNLYETIQDFFVILL